MIAMYGKYVIIDDSEVILISAKGLLCHKDVTSAGVPTSAGFFNVFIDDGKMKVHIRGGSSTLQLDSKPEDAARIRELLKFV